MCYFHGWSKLISDSDRWNRLGLTLTQWIGFENLSTPLGFMATFAESIGSIFIGYRSDDSPYGFFTIFHYACCFREKTFPNRVWRK